MSNQDYTEQHNMTPWNDEPQNSATPHDDLINALLDSRIYKSEFGWAAHREIKKLRLQNEEAASATGLVKGWLARATAPNLARKYSTCPVCSQTWWDHETHMRDCWVPVFYRKVRAILRENENTEE